MDADEIVKLSPEAIRDLLDSQRAQIEPEPPHSKRRVERWPFPGTVEVWLPDECYGERHMLATLHNLSLHGLAMRSRHPIQADTKISMAIHLPSLSCYGSAVVRHCTRANSGYLIGIEFVLCPDGLDEHQTYASPEAKAD